MLQGKQIDRMVAKVMRLGEVYSPYLIEERITPQVYITENGKTRAISAGDKWGGEFRCATFTFTVPVLGPFKYYVCADTGAPEHLVCVNGVKVGMLDYIDSAYDKSTRAHRYVLLENLKSGDCVSLEGYWSHTIYGNMPYDKKSTFSLGGYYPDRAFDKIELVRFNERLKLFSDKLEQLNILYRVCGDRERARIEEVYTALFGILPADSECPPDGLLDKAVVLIDKYLGAIVPREFPYVGLIGHSHLDTVWLWTLEETRRKYLRTVSNAVTLLDRYPDYTFFFSTVLYLKWLEDDDPSLFEKVVALIKEGRFEANGGAWVECDCNLTGGEALCRQLVRGIRWLREKTGYVPDTLWLPDAFGYSSALPQIMQSAGLKYFLTTKLRRNDTTKFPYESFRWKGIDGSEVAAHINTINTRADNESIARRLDGADKRENNLLMAYGFGDGGGGPSDEMVRRALDTVKTCPLAKAEHTTVSRFMHKLSEMELPTYFGELYLELHRGTFTSNHEIKKNNRRLEAALRDAELVSVFACDAALKAKTDALYDVLLLNQFHDILPGTCIAEAADEAAEQQRNAVAAAESIIAGEGGKAAYFNTLPFARTEMLPAAEGQSYEGLGGNTVTLAPFKFGAFGYGERCELNGAFSFDGRKLTSPELELTIEDGVITSLIYRGRQYVAGGLNVITFAENVPLVYDNWDIDADYVLKLGRARCTGCSLVSQGPYFAVVRLDYALTDKTALATHLILRADSPLIEFDNRLSVYDKRILVRAEFGLSLFAARYACETQFGNIVRDCYPRGEEGAARFEVCSHKYTDISEHNRGVSLFSDCKYGVSCNGSTLGLTLHKGGLHPDPRGDCGVHAFRYALYPHEGGLGMPTVAGGYAFNIPPRLTRRRGLTAPFAFKSDGTVVLETVKHGEDGGIALRMYESLGASSGAVLELPAGRTAYECNLLEDELRKIDVQTVRLDFSPFGIKTIVIK